MTERFSFIFFAFKISIEPISVLLTNKFDRIEYGRKFRYENLKSLTEDKNDEFEMKSLACLLERRSRNAENECEIKWQNK